MRLQGLEYKVIYNDKTIKNPTAYILLKSEYPPQEILKLPHTL